MGNNCRQLDKDRVVYCQSTQVTLKNSAVTLLRPQPQRFQSNLRLRNAEEIKARRVTAYQYLIP